MRIFTLPAKDTIIQPCRVISIPAATNVCIYSSNGGTPGVNPAQFSVLSPTSIEQPPYRNFLVQNCGTVPLKIKINKGVVGAPGSADDFHIVLPACVATDDGTSQPVDVAGDSPIEIWVRNENGATAGRLATYRSGSQLDDKN